MRLQPAIPLTTPRLVLEPLEAAHAAALFEPLQDARLYRWIPQEPPTSPEALAARYARLSGRRSPDGRQIWLNWAARLRPAFPADTTTPYAGTFQATVYPDSRALIAYMIFTPFQRQGYAREGCARMLECLTQQYAVCSIGAEIDTRNAASLALVESLGFTRVATHLAVDTFKGTSSDEHHYAYSPSPR